MRPDKRQQKLLHLAIAPSLQRLDQIHRRTGSGQRLQGAPDALRGRRA
jgi:hypothetical protein